MVKNPIAMQETWLQSRCWEDPLEEGMATLSSMLSWRIAIDRGAWLAVVHGVAELDMTDPLNTHLLNLSFSLGLDKIETSHTFHCRNKV